MNGKRHAKKKIIAQKRKLARHGLRRLLTEMSDRIGAVPPNAYQWEPVPDAPTTNCKPANQNICYRYLNETYLPGICATSIWKCEWEEEMIGGESVGICKPKKQKAAAELWAANCNSLFVGIE